MDKTCKEIIYMWELTTDAAHILHRIGSGEYPEIRHVYVAEADLPAWEEIALAEAAAITAAREAEAAYKRNDVALIRAFVEECKARAREAAAIEAERLAALPKPPKGEGEDEANEADVADGTNDNDEEVKEAEEAETGGTAEADAKADAEAGETNNAEAKEAANEEAAGKPAVPGTKAEEADVAKAD